MIFFLVRESRDKSSAYFFYLKTESDSPFLLPDDGDRHKILFTFSVETESVFESSLLPEHISYDRFKLMEINFL
jgi:hypothetical protein